MGMTETTAPVITTELNGHIVMAGPEGKLRAAVDAEHVGVLIEKGPYVGETVYVGAQQQDGPGGWRHYRVARELDHPVHGHIIYAYVDETRLGRAPRLKSALASQYMRGVHGVLAATERANAAVPACDNCGSCRLCV